MLLYFPTSVLLIFSSSHLAIMFTRKMVTIASDSDKHFGQTDTAQPGLEGITKAERQQKAT
jgi:hypothetical protein